MVTSVMLGKWSEMKTTPEISQELYRECLESLGSQMVTSLHKFSLVLTIPVTKTFRY